MYTLYNLLNVVKTIINQFGNGLYRLFMVKSEIVYYCFTMFYQHYKHRHTHTHIYIYK